MKYVLFIGGRVGNEALGLMTRESCDILHVFIEMEHEHEHEKYYQSSIEKCEKAGLSYSVNSTEKEIKEILTNNQSLGNSIDYIMSFGYRRMISDMILELASIAALGTHFSPLPRYRGFAPLNWLLINGENETAVNLFYLNKEVDSGDIIDRERVVITYEDDINTLFDKCIMTFRKVMKRVIPRLETCATKAIKQDDSEATYTCARNPEDGVIDWNRSSSRIYNLIRALTYPYPGAFSFINGRKIFIWSCEEYDIPKFEGRVPGKVIKILKNIGVVILCGEGAVLVKDVGFESGEMITADQVIKSIRLTIG